MDVTTLPGTLLAALLDGGARAVVRAAVGHLPARLVHDALADARGALVVVAVVAWLAAVLVVLIAASGGGPATRAPARGLPRPVAPLPPRRVRATGDAASTRPLPAAPVAVVRPRSSAATTRPVATSVLVPGPAAGAPASVGLPAPVPAGAAGAAAAPTGGTVVLARTTVADTPARAPVSLASPTGSVTSPPEERSRPVDHRHGPPPRPSAAPLPGSTRRAGDGSRCRRCTQPRCWPSTGERPPARVLGSGAPRACRTSLTAGTAHRCASADPRCGRARCTVPPPHLTLRGAR